jgi:uncharacterized protein (DUF427 family)
MADMPVNTNSSPGFRNHPEHKITAKPYSGVVRVFADSVKVAESGAAILLDEANHAPVYYLPIEDVDTSLISRSSHVTRCPFKGKATYWNLTIGVHEIDNAMWGYEMPYDEMLELAGMVAFFPSKVSIEVEPS